MQAMVSQSFCFFEGVGSLLRWFEVGGFVLHGGVVLGIARLTSPWPKECVVQRDGRHRDHEVWWEGFLFDVKWWGFKTLRSNMGRPGCVFFFLGGQSV